MPDPQNTREWAPQVDAGGKDEAARVMSNITRKAEQPSRDYAPSLDGGPDELAKGDKEFQQRAKEHQKRQEIVADISSGGEIEDEKSEASSLAKAMPKKAAVKKAAVKVVPKIVPEQE